jgi:hypothetical protein
MAVMDNHDDLFGNEALLPAQYYANRGERLNEPIKRLALAVLEDAIRCLQKPANGPIHRETRIWAESEQDGAFSLSWCCDLLGYDAAVWRNRLRNWEGKIAKRSAVNGNGGARPTLTRYRGHRARGRV